METDSIKDTVRAFVNGDNDILAFKAECDKSNGVMEWLQNIIDTMIKNDIPVKRQTIVMKNVAQNRSFQPKSMVEDFIPKYAIKDTFLSAEWRNCPPSIKKILNSCNVRTISGASHFFGIVSDIYFQIDTETARTEHYTNEYEFMLSVLPIYLVGGEAEEFAVRWIFPLYPETMKKGERKKAICIALKEAFTVEGKSYPRWIQSSGWAIGADNIPMVFTGQKGYKEYTEYYFKDKTTSEITVVRQHW